MFSKQWAGPVLFSILLLLYFTIVPREEDVDMDVPPGLGAVFGGRPVVLRNVQSARSAAPLVQWAEGSSRVLEELAGCLRAAADYRSPEGISLDAGPAGPAGGPVDGSPAQAEPEWPLDPAAYYRDVCLARLSSRAWIGFSAAYGERPRAWVLQLLSAAENDYDRLRLEPGMNAGEAWVRAFESTPDRVTALRRHLLGVYSLAAGEAEAADLQGGPSGDAPPDS